MLFKTEKLFELIDEYFYMKRNREREKKRRILISFSAFKMLIYNCKAKIIIDNF